MISSSNSGIYNVYKLPIDGSPATALTSSDKESYFAQGYFPNDDRFLFFADQEGNENFRIYMQSDVGIQKDLTPFDSVRSGFMGWSRDQKTMLISSNKRDPRFFDVYEKQIASLQDEISIGTMLYENKEGFNPHSIPFC